MPRIADLLAPMGRPHRLRARLASGFLFAIASLWCSTPALAQQLDKAVLDKVKDATVYVKIKHSGQPYSMGTGFVIKVTGNTVLVMTNRHVAAGSEDDEDERPGGKVKPEIFVVFRSGQAEAQELPANLVTFDHRRLLDLAILEVKGVRNPPKEPISVERPVMESQLFETMTTYTAGFPYSGVVGRDPNFNPPVTVTPLTITSFPRDEASGRIRRIQVSGPVLQGNSGGLVVNDKGTFVGVVVERIDRENVGFLIPPNVVTSFLAGDVDLLYGLVASWSGNVARIRFGGRMVDPFGKIRSMSLRYAKQSFYPSPLKPDNKGRYPILEKSTVVPMKLVPASAITDMPIADAAGVAEFEMTVNTAEERKILFQVVVTDSFGQPYGGEPVGVVVPERAGNFKEVTNFNKKPQASSRWSCEVNMGEGVKMTHQPGEQGPVTTISLPGDAAKTISTRHGMYNGPCALVQVDGDFVASVEVVDSFDPGTVGTMLPNGKMFPTSFQSTGLLVWQDEKNYVRLERCKGSEGGGGLGYLNQVWVEIYKNGKQAVSQPIEIAELPIGLLVVRKGASIRLLYAQLHPNQAVEYRVFEEMAVDFENEVFVGIAAANFSKRAFKAKLSSFSLRTPDNQPIVAKPVKMTSLIESGLKVLDDGTQVYEGALLKVAPPARTPIVKQKNMKVSFKGDWSDDKQLLWNNEKKTGALKLELPVDKEGKYEIKARFTKAPDYAIVKVEIDGTPLNKGATIDLYSQNVLPDELLSLGTLTLPEGKRMLTITISKKNDKSTGYHVGLDEIQLVPAKVAPKPATKGVTKPAAKGATR